MSKKFINKTITMGVGNDFVKKLAKNSNYEIENALYELIDNGLGADATKINIRTSKGTNGYTDLLVTDNGSGMSAKDFTKNAFFLGHSTTKNKENSAGYYGIGMKTGINKLCSAFSKITIKSTKKGCNPIVVEWDGGVKCHIQEVEDNGVTQGTQILITNSFFKNVKRFKSDTGAVYFYTLKNNERNIYINGEKIIFQDPFYRNVLPVNNLETKEFNLTYKNKSYVAKVTAVSLADLISNEQLNNFDCGANKKNGVKNLDRSGLYLGFGGRFTSIGGFNAFKDKKEQPTYGGIRVELLIQKELCEAFGIPWNKAIGFKKFTEITEIEGIRAVEDYISSFLTRNAGSNNIKNRIKREVAEEIITEEYFENNFNYPNYKINAVFDHNSDLEGRGELFELVEDYSGGIKKYLLKVNMNSNILNNIVSGKKTVAIEVRGIIMTLIPIIQNSLLTIAQINNIILKEIGRKYDGRRYVTSSEIIAPMVKNRLKEYESNVK